MHKAKIPHAFTGTTKPNATFTPDYVAYRQEGEPWQQQKDETQYRSRTTEKWKYNNPNKKSFYGTFSEFPRHIEEGPAPKAAIRHEKVWK